MSSIRTTRKQCTSVARVATGAGVAREWPLGLKSKSAILLTTSPLRVVLFTWSLHSQSIDGSIGPSGACKTRKDVAAIALTVSERSEPIILQILIEQTPRAAKIVKSPAKIASPSNFASPEQFGRGDNPIVLFPRDYLPCVKVPKYH